jgi:hypothetical protein
MGVCSVLSVGDFESLEMKAENPLIFAHSALLDHIFFYVFHSFRLFRLFLADFRFLFLIGLSKISCKGLFAKEGHRLSGDVCTCCPLCFISISYVSSSEI